MPSVKHSGNIGDVIYGLPVLKHISADAGESVKVYLNPIDERLSLQLLNVVKPLLEHQTYIDSVDVYAGEPIDYDLDLFRNHQHLNNLGYMHCAPFGLDTSITHKQSIFLDESLKYDLPVVDLIINRTERYTNDQFPWESLLKDQYSNASKGFVGLPHEYDIFVSKFNLTDVAYIPTKDYLEVAWLINKSQLFIGNCSSPYAIAEGMKHNTIQESCTWLPYACMFPRENAHYFLNDFFKAT